MSEVIKFPKPDRWGDSRRPWTLEEYNSRGTVHTNVEAMSRWLRGFTPFDAAMTCATAKSRDDAVAWWRSHIEDFKAALRVRGVKDDQIEDLRLEYTARVRQHVKRIRGAQWSMREWNARKAWAHVDQCYVEKMLTIPETEGKGAHHA
jgi:hypothetical protein